MNISPETFDALLKLIAGGAITAGLFALSLWFLTRYVKQRDDFETAITKKIDDIPSQIKSKVDEVKIIVDQVKTSQKALNEEILKHKSESLEIQKRVSEELLQIEKHVVAIEATLDRTTEKADKLDGSLTTMNERVQFHDKALTGVVEWAKKTKAQLDDLQTDYKTTKENINKDLIILKTKKQKT